MKVKASLFFRSFKRKTINDKSKIEVHFLDENDSPFVFLLDDNQENQKYFKMQKDQKCDLDLVVYIPRNKTYQKYGLWVV